MIKPAKVTTCTECEKELAYTTKKPLLCKECKTEKYGTRKPYRKPKGIPQKSKGEFILDKVLNNLLPDASYISGGYYSFLPSPKGYPMQLDRYYPRLHLAFEFNGKQHEEDIDYFFKSKEEYEYRLECDKVKKDMCDDLNIKILYVYDGEYITKDLIMERMEEAGIADTILSRTKISI